MNLKDAALQFAATLNQIDPQVVHVRGAQAATLNQIDPQVVHVRGAQGMFSCYGSTHMWDIGEHSSVVYVGKIGKTGYVEHPQTGGLLSRGQRRLDSMFPASYAGDAPSKTTRRSSCPDRETYRTRDTTTAGACRVLNGHERASIHYVCVSAWHHHVYG
uniref:Uncharacterized protein n=1 Tax=Hyaloperonospora arabidopsidis (strain Emoy2) TaxID=559515 RepID=M4BD51_HYAAE